MSALDELIQHHESLCLSLEPESQGYILRDCSEARAELAALRERVAKLEAALAKADEIICQEGEHIDNEGFGEFAPTSIWICAKCSQSGESRGLIPHVGECAEYRAAREAAK